MIHNIIIFIFMMLTWLNFEKASKEKNWVRFWVSVVMMIVCLLTFKN